MRVGAVGQLLGIGDTGLDRDGLTAVILDVDDQLLGGRAVAAVVDDHAGTVGGQPAGDRAADATRASRDNRDLLRCFLAGCRRDHRGHPHCPGW